MQINPWRKVVNVFSDQEKKEVQTIKIQKMIYIQNIAFLLTINFQLL